MQLVNSAVVGFEEFRQISESGVKICIATATNRWECRIFSRPESLEILEYKI